MNPPRPIAAVLLLTTVLLSCVSCRIGPPLPAANFSAPGWQVQQGQAVWKPAKKRPELAGDLLLATNRNGDCVVQFSKIPFMLADARVSGNAWQMDFGGGKYLFRGRGAPPKRFAWFQLPRSLDAQQPPPPWKFARHADGSWRLENLRSGEFVEGAFFP